MSSNIVPQQCPLRQGPLPKGPPRPRPHRQYQLIAQSSSACQFNRRPVFDLIISLSQFVPLMVTTIVCLDSVAMGAIADDGNPADDATHQEAIAAKAPANDSDRAALVRVRLPLVGSADVSIRNMVQRAADRLLAAARRRRDLRRPVLVLQLDPPIRAEGDGEGSQFERAFALARYLCSSDLAGVRKVAYLPKTVRGHGTLLAIACEELIMAPDAEIGDAGIDEREEGTIRQTVVAGYREIAEARRTIPEALALGMIDPSVEVLQIDTEDGVHFVLQKNLKQFASHREIIDKSVLVPRGTLARFTGREGRQFGFVKYLADSKQAVARALDVPVESLEEDQSLLADWNPILLDINGPVTPRLASQFETLVGSELDRRDVNWIGVRIDSAGGDLEASIRLATMLARLDTNSVRTVAYIPVQAAGGAAVVALACDQVIMHPNARLTAAQPTDQKGQDAEDASLDAARSAIRDSVAPRVQRDWSLLAAMIDPRLEVFLYHNKATGQQRLMSGEEAAQLPNTDDWQRGDPLQEPNKPLQLTGDRAKQLGVAWEEVDSFDQLKQLYGLVNDPRQVKPNWALDLVEALSSPAFAGLLLMVAFTGIYLELRSPGIGVGAFVAAVGFLLFFWSKGLHGTADWLEVLLFIGGISFILLEIFVLPGFGIFGLGGGALVVASLVLASQTFVLPQSESQIVELRNSLAVVAIASVGVIAVAFAARHYLPQAPVFNRMVLAPPQDEERAALAASETVADFSHLVGLSGTAQTDLLPTGKALINHQMIDVIVEAEPIDRGTPLVVVSAHANRVVVRAASDA